MEQVLQYRETIIRFYKRYDTIILIILKFIVGAVIFSLIAGVDRSLTMFAKLASTAASIPYIVLMSLIFAVTPINAGYLLITFNLCLQTSAVLEVALVLGVFLLGVQGLYTRLASTECVLILLMLIAYYFKLPYAVPIFAGLYFGLTAFIPILIAAFMWQFLPLMLEMFKAGSETVLSIDGLTEIYQSSYTQIVSAVTGNRDWIIISFVYACVVIMVYLASRAAIDYSKDIAIALGGLVTIIGFSVAILITGVKVGFWGMLLSAIVSTALVYAIRFFDVLLDYRSVERVQFQDEDNVYYVKIVPKINIEAEAPEPPVRKDSEPERVRSDREGRARPESKVEWAGRYAQIERDREDGR